MFLLFLASVFCILIGFFEIFFMGAVVILGFWGRGVRGLRREDDGRVDGGGVWVYGDRREDRV